MEHSPVQKALQGLRVMLKRREELPKELFTHLVLFPDPHVAIKIIKKAEYFEHDAIGAQLLALSKNRFISIRKVAKRKCQELYNSKDPFRGFDSIDPEERDLILHSKFSDDMTYMTTCKSIEKIVRLNHAIRILYLESSDSLLVQKVLESHGEFFPLTPRQFLILESKAHSLKPMWANLEFQRQVLLRILHKTMHINKDEWGEPGSLFKWIRTRLLTLGYGKEESTSHIFTEITSFSPKDIRTILYEAMSFAYDKEVWRSKNSMNMAYFQIVLTFILYNTVKSNWQIALAFQVICRLPETHWSAAKEYVLAYPLSRLPELIPELIEMFKLTDYDEIAAFASFFVNTGNNKFIELILKALQISYPEFKKHLVEQLNSKEEELFETSHNILFGMCFPDNLDLLLDHPNPTANRLTIEALLQQWDPNQVAQFQMMLASKTDGDLFSQTTQFKEIASGFLTEFEGEEWAAGCLELLLDDDNSIVRTSALRAINEHFPDTSPLLCIKMLGDRNFHVKLEALRGLELDNDHDIWRLPKPVLALTHDVDEDVRREALSLLAEKSLHCTEVQAALVMALRDEDHDVRETVTEVIQYRPDLINRACDLETTFHWGCRIGRELLGKSLMIKPCQEEVGRTAINQKGQNITIEVTSDPIAYGSPLGVQAVKGIILHEIGHQLFDSGIKGSSTIHGQVQSEGLGQIYNILQDIRLERIMRSRRSEWNHYFDAAISYVFLQSETHIALEELSTFLGRPIDSIRDDVAHGRLPGRLFPKASSSLPHFVILRGRDSSFIPGFLPPLSMFLLLLRQTILPQECWCKEAREAYKLIPTNIKDLNHADLFKLAREVAFHLGREDQIQAKREQLNSLLENLQQLKQALKKLLNQTQVLHNQLGDRELSPGTATDHTLPFEDTLESENINQIATHQKEKSLPLHTRKNTLKAKSLFLGENLDFDRLEKTEVIEFNHEKNQEIIRGIRNHIRVLKPYFEKLGRKVVEIQPARRGRRLDLASVRKSPILTSPNLLVHSIEEQAPDLYLGVLIDKSGSMEGDNLVRAKSFATVIAESARGLRDIAGHINAFDDDTFHQLGSFQRHAIGSLEAWGGNNDSGGLLRAAKLAMKSHKKRKVIIMISDGSPTQCSFESLKNLVWRLSHHHGIILTQVAVSSIAHVAFPHHVDLSEYTFQEAVTRFGKMVMRLTGNM